VEFREWKQRKQASRANQLVLDRRIRPCMSEVFPWENIPLAHQMMWKNRHKPGNMAVPVNAPRAGLRNFDDVLEAAGGGCAKADMPAGSNGGTPRSGARRVGARCAPT
jgi:hypothetical protein